MPGIRRSRIATSHGFKWQTDHVFDRLLTGRERTAIRSLFLSNNGSMFDDPTFSPLALHHAVARAVEVFPNLGRIVIETRAEFVTDDKLSALVRLRGECGSDLRLELALGVEVFDDRLRNKVAHKGLSRRGIERLVETMGRHGFDLRCYFMLKPDLPAVVPGSNGPLVHPVARLGRALDPFGIAVGQHRGPPPDHPGEPDQFLAHVDEAAVEG